VGVVEEVIQVVLRLVQEEEQEVTELHFQVEQN
jgi:hypothetical protein